MGVFGVASWVPVTLGHQGKTAIRKTPQATVEVAKLVRVGSFDKMGLKFEHDRPL